MRVIEDHRHNASYPTLSGNGDLSRMTIREAILTVLTEAKPEPARTRDLDRTLTGRRKKVQGGVSVDLTAQENIHAVVIFAPELMQLRQALVQCLD